MTFGESFAQTGVRGALTRAAVASVLITPAVAAAKIWWSATAAVIVFLVAVTAFVVVAVRYRRRHPSDRPVDDGGQAHGPR
jgi:membrane protein YdbS with pleckstrin-like domain